MAITGSSRVDRIDGRDVGRGELRLEIRRRAVVAARQDNSLARHELVLRSVGQQGGYAHGTAVFDKDALCGGV